MDLRQGAKTGIDLALGINRTITGKVAGLVDGEISWVEAWSSSTNHWTVTKVQADGVFILTGLRKAGDYQIAVEAEGYQNPAPITVNLTNDTTSLANFNLSRGGSIKGTITGLVAGNVVTVEVSSLKLKDSRETTLVAFSSDALPYVVEGLANADDYIVRLHTDKGNFFYSATVGTKRGRKEATAIDIAYSASRNGIDFNIASAVSYTLSGTITGLTEADGNLKVSLTAWAQEDGFGSTRRIGNGSWSIPGLPTGNYHIAVSAPRYVDQVYSGNEDGSVPAWSTKQDQGTSVTISDDLSGLVVNLASGYTLIGILTDPTGTAVSEVYVNAWDATQDVGGGVLTRVDGSFEITGLQGGKYVVEAMTSVGRLTQELTLNKDSDMGTLKLVKEAGIIRGITTAAGMVFVYDAGEVFVGTTVANGSGAYQIDGLETGVNYRVDVDTDGDFGAMEFTGNANPTVSTPEVVLDLQ